MAGTLGMLSTLSVLQHQLTLSYDQASLATAPCQYHLSLPCVLRNRVIGQDKGCNQTLAIALTLSGRTGFLTGLAADLTG